jgi:hypothetical protein
MFSFKKFSMISFLLIVVEHDISKSQLEKIIGNFFIIYLITGFSIGILSRLEN